jgi:hypothetical protein
MNVLNKKESARRDLEGCPHVILMKLQANMNFGCTISMRLEHLPPAAIIGPDAEELLTPDFE